MSFCVDIGGSFIKFGLASGPETVRQVDQVPTPRDDWPAFVAALADLVARHGAGEAERTPLAISTAGLVDPETGVVTTASNIPAIVGHSLTHELSAALGRPVLVANDADCFALAEAIVGAGRGHRVVFGIILGTGVGGGLVVDGRPVPGIAGISGEWGHGPVAKPLAGTPPVAIPRFRCGCGQTGCLDTIGSARGLERLHRHLHRAEADSRQIIAAWSDGDPAAGRTVDIYIEMVAEPLSMLVNTLGAGVLPVGGGLSSALPLVSALDRAVRGLVLRATDRPLLVPAELGPNAGLIGAAVLASTEAPR